VNARQTCAVWAEETLQILERGDYSAPSGRTITLHTLQQAITQSRLYRPSDIPTDLTIEVAAKRYSQPTIEVTAETTLAAAQRLAARATTPLCLNFASAKKPGGGFLSGAQAQEESLARSSGLYPCLAQMNEMYEHNRALKTCLYSDYLIYSPDVPVFRQDNGALLEEPYLAAFITAPAVNAAVVRERELTKLPLIRPTMLRRLQRVLGVALQHGHTHLVLGAWGCGVFGNDPYQIAELFAETLGAGGMFDGCFQHIVYAVYDRTPNRAVFAPFQRRLG
jgi:uncharacterized protein (TIGR02452 family)